MTIGGFVGCEGLGGVEVAIYLTDNEARIYLEKRTIPGDTDKLIRECGSRILTLQDICEEILGGNGLDGSFALLISALQI